MMDFLKGTVTPKDWGIVAGILIALVAVVLLYGFVIHGKMGESKERIMAENAQVLGDLQQARQIKANIDMLRQETQKIDMLVSEFEQRLPTRREIPTLVREFEALGKEEGVDADLETVERAKDARKETIPYNIVVYGTFHEIASFVNKLERFRRYLKISDLEIGPEKAGICEATFVLSTYRFLQADAAGGTS